MTKKYIIHFRLTYNRTIIPSKELFDMGDLIASGLERFLILTLDQEPTLSELEQSKKIIWDGSDKTDKFDVTGLSIDKFGWEDTP